MRETVLKVLEQHYPTQGVMGSPDHWAHRSNHGTGNETVWFAHCGNGWPEEKGCGWDSEPDVYPDKMTARRAALEHVADELLKELS